MTDTLAKNPKKVVIFDFDGTLADTGPIIRGIYTELAAKNKWQTMTDEDYDRLRRGSVNEARKWTGIRWWQYPGVLRNAKRLMKLEAEKVELFPGMPELIAELKAEEVDVYILSLNLSDTIRLVLERNNLLDKVEVLRRRKRSFGKKAAVIAHLVQQKGYDKNTVWMVGDEVRDILAAKIVGVNSVAVAWGLQDVSILKLQQPSQIAATVQELRKILLP
jgi:phosphoglycolate phosphatase